MTQISHRYEVSVQFNRPLDHPRDDVEVLARNTKLYFKRGVTSRSADTSMLSVANVVVDEATGRARLIVELDGTPSNSRQSMPVIDDSVVIRAFRRQILRRYNESTDRGSDEKTSASASGQGGTPSLVGLARRGAEKPRQWKGKMLNQEKWERAKERACELDELPDDAPDLTLSEQYIRTLEADSAPFEVSGGDADV